MTNNSEPEETTQETIMALSNVVDFNAKNIGKVFVELESKVDALERLLAELTLAYADASLVIEEIVKQVIFDDDDNKAKEFLKRVNDAKSEMVKKLQKMTEEPPNESITDEPKQES